MLAKQPAIDAETIINVILGFPFLERQNDIKVISKKENYKLTISSINARQLQTEINRLMHCCYQEKNHYTTKLIEKEELALHLLSIVKHFRDKLLSLHRAGSHAIKSFLKKDVQADICQADIKLQHDIMGIVQQTTKIIAICLRVPGWNISPSYLAEERHKISSVYQIISDKHQHKNTRVSHISAD